MKIINKISIITVCLNSEKTLQRCIDSVYSQNYNKKKIQHIVIDGKSKDKTLNIIKKNKKKLFYWKSSKDTGIYDAMNKAILKCTGDIIGVLNSDDYYYKNTLKLVNQYFENHDLDYLFGSVDHKKIYHGFYPEKIWYKFNIYPSHSVSFFIRRKSQTKIGFYDKRFKYSADRDLFFRLIKSQMKGMSTKKNEIFGKFNVHGISSKLSFIKYTILEESKIRIKNKQNLLFVFCLGIVAIIYKVIRSLIK